MFGNPPTTLSAREVAGVSYAILASFDEELYWAVERSVGDMDDLGAVLRQVEVWNFR